MLTRLMVPPERSRGRRPRARRPRARRGRRRRRPPCRSRRPSRPRCGPSARPWRAPSKGRPPRDLEERLVRVVHSGHDADPLARQPASVHLLAAVPGGARHRERPLRVVALERLGEIGLVELAAAAPLDPERGGSRPRGTRSACGAWCGGLEADAAAPRAFAQGQHEHEALGVGHLGLLRELARPQDALAAHAEGPAAAPAEVALLAVLRFALLHDRGGPAARAAFNFVGGAGRVVGTPPRGSRP